MKTSTLVLILFAVSLGVPLCLLAQEESLGNIARQQRELRAKEAPTKPVKLYTNDNLPARPPGEGPTAASSMSGGTSEAGPPPAIRPEVGTAEMAKKAAESAGSTQQPAAKPQPAENKVKDKEYWQAQFKTVRGRLARAKEEQQLAEDELNLLQIQQARAIDASAKQQLDQQVTAKQAEVDTQRAATAKVQKTLDDLEREFKDSGSPEDWSKTE